MNDIWYGILQAFQLIYTLDQDLIDISVRSLQVTLSALVISSLFALPLAAVLAVKRFKFRRFIIALLNALMGLPPVVVGLIVYILYPVQGLLAFWIYSTQQRPWLLHR